MWTSMSQEASLAELRREIDRIDAAMHALLIERGEIIDRLIRAKRTQESGSAFRPAREAEMMRRLLERHRGILPLDTAESIWRVIIATFTYIQAPYALHADLSSGESAMRDSARFHFGFTVPFIAHMGAAAAVAAAAAAPSDLALVPATLLAGAPAWWPAIEPDNEPKIIARLPFVERADHPAGLPPFVVSHPAPDRVVREVGTWSGRVAGWGGGAGGGGPSRSGPASRGAGHGSPGPRGEDRWGRSGPRWSPPVLRSPPRPSSAATPAAIWFRRPDWWQAAADRLIPAGI